MCYKKVELNLFKKGSILNCAILTGVLPLQWCPCSGIDAAMVDEIRLKIIDFLTRANCFKIAVVAGFMPLQRHRDNWIGAVVARWARFKVFNKNIS